MAQYGRLRSGRDNPFSCSVVARTAVDTAVGAFGASHESWSRRGWWCANRHPYQGDTVGQTAGDRPKTIPLSNRAPHQVDASTAVGVTLVLTAVRTLRSTKW